MSSKPIHSDRAENARQQKSVNAALLVVARESRGMSQCQLSEALSVSQSKVSKYESGILDVTNLDLQRIATLLEYPEEFFYATDTVCGFGSDCHHHRKRQSLPIKELKIIHATTNAIRVHSARLLTSVNIEYKNAMIRMDIDEYGTPENIAKMIRVAWGLPMGPIRNLVSVIEQAGGIVFQYPFETDRIDAVSLWAGHLPPFFFVNKDLPIDRWRFSLAHELGHLIMHRVPSPTGENEANRFASEFLMPEREIADELTGLSLADAARLKPYWRVSMQAIIRKAHELKRITPRHYQSLCAMVSKLGYRKNEPVSLEPEAPTVLRDLIDVHQNAFGYSVEQLSKVALSWQSHFERLFLCEGTPRLRLIS